MRSLRETPPSSSEPPSDPPPEMNPAAKPFATPVVKAVVKATPAATAAKPIVKPVAALVKPVAVVVKPVPIVEVKSAEPVAIIEPIPAAEAVVVEEAVPALVEASLAALTLEEAAEPAPEAAPSVLNAYLVIAPDLPPSIWKQIGTRLAKQNALLSLTAEAEPIDAAIITAAIAKARDAYVLKREKARISSSARRAAKKILKQESEDAPEAEAAPLETPAV
jgi:hypothetical protein